MVLDLRGNGGGYLDGAIDLADEFLKKGELITYTEGRSRPRMEYRATTDGRFEDVRLAIIIDGFSASASEILAGCMQDLGRATVVGSRSFGKGLVQEQNEWTDGSATRLTVARYYTPNGRSIQRPYNEQGNYERTVSDSLMGGISPDIEVKRDTSGITWLYAEAVHLGLLNRFAYEFRDRQMDRLIEYDEMTFIHEVTEEEIKNALYTYLKADMGDLNEREWQRSSQRMVRRVKAVIGRSMFNDETYFRIHNPNDNFVEAALQSLHFPDQKTS
jgi:carboxyl-terminal processing protease